MNRRSGLAVAVGIMLWMVLARSVDLFAYEVETHRAISEVAASRSTVDGQLKESLAISAGVEAKVREESLLKWILDGSLRADDWTYFFNHFHNPLAADWSQAGFGPGYSAILWGQTSNQGYPSWSWQNTRQYFLDALTSMQKADRDLGLTMTFQGLGHLIHLIQDMASPAHTRNDPHRSYSYESLVRDVQLDPELPVARAFLDWINRPSLGPDPGWQTLARNDLAPIPIARLTDTDLYRGVNPEATIQPLMGLAEYTNANYLSEDRLFRETEILWRFPYPRRSSVTVADYGIMLRDDTPVTRQYFRKDFDGDSGYRLATVGFLRDYIQRYGLDPGRYGDSPALDEAVYRDYAERLLPRAVGYSTALLDYFFRGKLEAAIEADPTDSEKLQVTAKNASSEPLGRGTLAVYGDYADAERRPLGSWPIPGAVAPGGELPSQSFSPPKPIPARYMVVYQGDLGEEKKDNPPGFGGAVIGKATKYGGVLEELILFRTASNTWDVYFRNQFQIVLLGLSEDLPVIPMVAPWGPDIYRAEVHWGADSNHFFVKNYETRTVADDEIGVPVYRIYKIDRPDNSVSGDEPVRAVLVKTIRPRETRLPNPYGYREVWIDAPQHNRTGEMVYPYGLVFTAPYFGVQVQVSPSRQEVLSEDLGDGNGLEIYALFEAWASDEIFYLEPHGGSGQGVLGVSLIIQASTGAIVYEDPVSGSYKAQVGTAVSHGHYADGWFVAFPRTWIVSWSDRDVTRRRWVTQLRADDFYLTYDVTADNSITNEADHFVENSVQTVLIENGRPKFYLTPKQTYVAYSPYQGASPEEIFFPSALVPTMSSENWLWIDEPDSFFGSQILRRTQYLMSTETSMKQRVGEWTPPDSTQFVIAPKIREMVMLQPGFMYAHGEPVYAIPALLGYGGSFYPLLQDLTSNVEKQKFVRFLAPDGRVDPAFTTSVPLLEDTDLRGKGRVRTDTYPSEFQAVLDTLLNPGSDSQVSWHVVPDADLVPARRR
jgi:hypothetical protein